MANVDLGLKSVRQKIIQEIQDENNKARKRASLKAFEIYKNRHADFIIEKLREERALETVKFMRKSLSLNLSRRIVDELASIYNDVPDRTFGEVNDRELEQLENLYFHGDVNNKLCLANKYYKLCNQAFIQVLPQMGKIGMKVFLPHHVDVIPDARNPELPFAYIINVFDKFDFLANTNAENFVKQKTNDATRPQADRINQTIADEEDYRAKLGKFIVWTKDLHFTMNGSGEVLEENQDETVNPIGMLPFIDVSGEKDFEFFVREGHQITDFAIEMSADLSDVDEIYALQGYAQGIITSEKEPQSIIVGPNRLLHLKLDPNRPEMRPSFEFVSPSPNIDAGMTKIENKIKLFLTSMGLDPKIINTDSQRFNSGLERLLAMIEKFEASQKDIELFRDVEQKVMPLMVAWSNLFQGVTDPEMKLMDDLNISAINDNVTLEVQFQTPEMIMTQKEREESVVFRLEKGLMTKKEAIMELRGVDEEMAEKILEEITQDDMRGLPNVIMMRQGEDGQEEVSSDEESGEEQPGA